MYSKLGFMIVICCAWVTSVEATMVWKPVPQQHEGMNHGRMPPVFELQEGEGANVIFVHSDLKQEKLELNHAKRLSLKSTGKDNYHVLIANKTNQGVTETALRYVYQYGRPTGFSPTDVTTLNKVVLEIVPMPLPREHWQYKSAAEAIFSIHFLGQPLANKEVLFLSSHGNQQNLKTNGKGELRVILPDDFSDIKAGRMANAAAEFQVLVEHVSIAEGESQHVYKTSYTAPYYVNANHWQNLPWGLMVTLSGMFVAGLWVFRSRKNKKVKVRR